MNLPGIFFEFLVTEIFWGGKENFSCTSRISEIPEKFETFPKLTSPSRTKISLEMIKEKLIKTKICTDFIPHLSVSLEGGAEEDFSDRRKKLMLS